MSLFFKKSALSVSTLIGDQMEAIKECLISFETFIKANLDEKVEMAELKECYEAVHQSENKADKALRRMIDSLDSSFLPSSRSELIEIAASCDKIANKWQGLAHLILLQRFHYPKSFEGDIRRIVEITLQQFTVLQTAIAMLFDKFGLFLKDHTILDDIRNLESQVDVIEESLNERIYSFEMDLAHQRQLGDMVQWLCDGSDIIENIADKLQIIVVSRKV